MTPAATGGQKVRLSMSGIEKSFGGVQALKGAELSAEAGEILGLCGENGAGKSTLLKVLSGVHPYGTFRGEVRVDGVAQRYRGIDGARRAGIAIVHQELMLLPQLTVAENLYLGREPRRFGLLDDARLEADAGRLLTRFGFHRDVDVRAPVGTLGIGLQQIVEIVRGLSFDARVLVLDEPTAALTQKESDRLMSLLRELRAAGTTCIYVSHRMDEVFALCDRITVLRDGRTAGTVTATETTPAQVIAMMVGRELAPSTTAASRTRRTSSAATGNSAAATENSAAATENSAAATESSRGLSLDKLTLRVSPTATPFQDISLRVRPGEVLAVCGAMGAGRTALLSSLFGCAVGRLSGDARLDGERLHLRSPAEAIARGLALLPEDRKGRGLVLGMSVAENLLLPWLSDPSVMGAGARLGLVDGAAETTLAKARIRELSIRGAPSSVVSTLSGGNQQKVVLGKWLARPPRVLLLDEPTRGVDVGAREEIYALVEALCEKGVAVLLASSDLPEVLRLAHRVLVLRHGRVVGELDGAGATQAAIVHLATGATTVDAAA